MKEKSAFTEKSSNDYTQSKDAYEGNRESAVCKDSPVPAKKLPESFRPRKDGPGGN